MKQEATSRLILIGLALLLGLTSYAAVKVVAVGRGIENLIEIAESPMQKITQTVTRADGTSAEITTPRNTNADGTAETLAAWKARHDAAVQEFKDN